MRYCPAFAAFVFFSGSLSAAGLVVPEDRHVPPLAMVSHRVDATIDDQVGVTYVEQIFRNHTSRPLEATYLFPVPKGASVDKFVMWIDGRETTGELLDAKKAKKIYTDIVRRTLDPGLLEYVGSDLLQMKVFPVPPRGDVKVKIRFTALAVKDHGLVEYTYPLRTSGKATRTLEDFSVKIQLKSQQAIASIYSPTHNIDIARHGSHSATIGFEKNQSLLDKDFLLYYGTSDREIGLNSIVYRPVGSEDGYFMFLISPEIEAAKNVRVARDLVLVLDTSGSMSDVKLTQARKALKYCLAHLGKEDRFALVNFATTVRTFKDDLCDNTRDNVELANKWVDDLRQSGGTAILPALNRALDFSTSNATRPFTVAFFTDGMPTVDETDPVKIVEAITSRNNSSTRIFTFGVGDDVNAAMLDQLADVTKAVTTYVRPNEDIEVKVSSLHDKISQPVLTNIKLTATNVKLHEIYPARIPDLFFGGQLVVMGRYSGKGPSAIRLKGQVGSDSKEFIYEQSFPERTRDGKKFVEHLWARRKVGYILDQIRINGEKYELVEEVTKLAKQYGIATPYTSYLVVPDSPMPTYDRRRGAMPNLEQNASPGFGGGFTRLPIPPIESTARAAQIIAGETATPGGIAAARGAVQEKQIAEALRALKPEDRGGAYAGALAKAAKDATDNKKVADNYRLGDLQANQAGCLGVDLALACNQLRNQDKLSVTANRAVQGRNCVEFGGMWIDDRFTAKTPTCTVKAQSDAYFKLLDLHPELKDVYVLGNHVVWMTPNGTALVIDASQGKTTIGDSEIEKLFASR